METQRTAAPSSEDQALRDWQAATEQVSKFAAKAESKKVDEATFEEMRRLRGAEREAWQRCRPHWSE
ncbi:MAG: hypothetical protein LH645_12580 [Actinomycetia bacterium]|jgi:hypothetical protein|nr:hypothetical protein [Actinomycetes bacterium]